MTSFMVVLGTVAACATHTPLDQLWYPSEIALFPADQLDTDAVCYGLEERGYQFDELEVNNRFLAVNYPDGTQAQYPTSAISVSARLLTSIRRDFDNPQDWSDEELDRLMIEAKDVCQSIQAITQSSYGNSVYVTLILQDWIVGARAIASTSEIGNCESLQWQSLSYGSYGDASSGMTCTQEQ